MDTEKKENRGGKRDGAGPPFKYGEETVTIAFRVPISKAAEIRVTVNQMLKKYINKKSNAEAKGGHYGC